MQTERPQQVLPGKAQVPRQQPQSLGQKDAPQRGSAGRVGEVVAVVVVDVGSGVVVAVVVAVAFGALPGADAGVVVAVVVVAFNGAGAGVVALVPGAGGHVGAAQAATPAEATISAGSAPQTPRRPPQSQSREAQETTRAL
mmetsp:Transcript_61618/g.198462  ORF Transcript_61618/g.198462 Transcript_61618/m.198462 type:complete len:141 (-) Transcript_61618:479-901(-)